MPLLEQVCDTEPVFNGSQEISDLLGPELTSSRGPAAMLLPLNKSAGPATFRSDIHSIHFFLHCMYNMNNIFFCILRAVLLFWLLLFSCKVLIVKNMIVSAVQTF